MIPSKSKVLLIALLATVVAGAGWASRPTKAAPDESAAPAPAVGKEPPRDDVTTCAGRVLDPDGKPVAGAKLAVSLDHGEFWRLPPSAVCATSGSDGRFRFEVGRAKLDKYGGGTVVAAADGYGPAWTEFDPRGGAGGLTLRLVKDDVPVRGRVVDLEGRPVRGATVRLQEIRAAPGDDLGPWLALVKGRKGDFFDLEQGPLTAPARAADVPGLAAAARTDADGRFSLKGIGRERFVLALVEGPAIATQEVRFLTRPGETFFAARRKSEPAYGTTPLHGSIFTHTAMPTRVVVGVVRDKDTKKPLAGARVQSDALAGDIVHGRDLVRAVTDAEGRYRLAGLPKGEGNAILVVPPDDQPYLVIGREMKDTPELDPVTVDFELKRGVWVTGRVTDKKTGQPVAARVDYFTPANNPRLANYAGLLDSDRARHWVITREDGTFRLVGLPGPGIVSVEEPTGKYLDAASRDDAEGAAESLLNTEPGSLHPANCHAVARFDVPEEVQSIRRDIALVPGMTVTASVAGPDGKPLAGARVYGREGRGRWGESLEEASFVLRNFNPRRPRLVLVRHDGKSLAAALEMPADATKEIAVRLRPAAVVAGRLVDGDGRPRAGVELRVWFRREMDSVWATYERATTDGDGRFRLGALLPGLRYSLGDGRGDLTFGAGLREGDTKNLGDVCIKTPAE